MTQIFNEVVKSGKDENEINVKCRVDCERVIESYKDLIKTPLTEVALSPGNWTGYPSWVSSRCPIFSKPLQMRQMIRLANSTQNILFIEVLCRYPSSSLKFTRMIFTLEPNLSLHHCRLHVPCWIKSLSEFSYFAFSPKLPQKIDWFHEKGDICSTHLEQVRKLRNDVQFKNVNELEHEVNVDEHQMQYDAAAVRIPNPVYPTARSQTTTWVISGVSKADSWRRKFK